MSESCHFSNHMPQHLYFTNICMIEWNLHVYLSEHKFVLSKNNPRHMGAIELQNVRISELFLMLQSFANKGYYSDLNNDINQIVCCFWKKQAQKGFRPLSSMKGTEYFQNLRNFLRNCLEFFFGFFWGVQVGFKQILYKEKYYSCA